MCDCLAGTRSAPDAMAIVNCALSIVRCKRGGVAQMGERLLCKQEAIGSIPFISTSEGRTEGGQSQKLKA